MILLFALALAAGVFAPNHAAWAAFPTTGILDNFNRADENPLANGTWTCPERASDSNVKLVSNQATWTGAVSNSCYWSAATFGSDTEVFMKIAVKPVDTRCVSVQARISGAGSANISGYWGEFCAASGTDTWDLYRFDSGAATHIGTGGLAELTAGDSIGLEVIGSNIKLYYKPAAGAWTLETSATDSTYSGSGRIGMVVENSGADSVAVDDFGGGTVALGVQVSSRSDTLSDSRQSATSNHTVAFKVNNAVYGSSLSGSSTLILTLPSGFTIPVGMDCGDVDAATSVQFSFNYPGCASTATAWGFSATGSSITLVPPSGTGVYVPTSTQVTIKIGSNATVGQQGGHWITNPAVGGVYTISVGGTFGGSGNMLVSINAGVSVQATVAESLSFTVSPSVTSIKWVQDNFTNTANNTGALSTFSSNNAAGNLIIVALDWNSQAVNVLSVTDTKGNVYTAAAPPVNGQGNLSSWRDQIFYAKNIGAGANTVNVEFSGSVHSELYIHEYSGADTSSPLDVTASSIGSLSPADSGSKTTNFPNELIFGYCQGSVVNCYQGTNFASRRTDNGNLSEDTIATSTGSYSANSNLSGNNDWIISMATFKPAPGCIGDDGAAVNAIATTATSVPFGIISPNTFYQGCQDLIVSTNASNGYSVTVQESSAFRTADGRFTIPDTTCDAGDCTVATATTWVTPNKNGFGHTCFNQSGSDCNPSYGSGQKFKPVPSIPTGTSPGQISFVQTNARDSGAASTSNVLAFNFNNTAGNLIVAAVEWSTATSATSSITDSNGNVYASAIGPIHRGSSAFFEQIFYAKNIAGGANTVTVKLTGQSQASLEVYLHEYSGADQTSPFDVTSAGSADGGTAMDSGSKTTNFASELIFGFGTTGAVSSPGVGFTSRNTFNSNMTEDKQVSSAGSYNATETSDNGLNSWALLMATFRASNTPVSLMSNTGTVTNSTGRVKYRLSAGAAQPAGTYTTIVTYTIYASY